MTFRLALTGSIGMGKSTTAQMFRDLGVPVWDADETVQRLYARGGAAVPEIGALIPDAIVDGAVDRNVLKDRIRKAPRTLEALESLVHPLVAADRQKFLDDNKDQALVIFDIPLLFETGGQDAFDGVLVVTTDAETQASRVLSRPGMSEDLFQDLLARQMPDGEKRLRADHVIETCSLEKTRADVKDLVQRLTGSERGSDHA